MAHVVQLANLVTPTSGGIRATMARLSAGYRARGHRTSTVVPGPTDRLVAAADGRTERVEIGSRRIPGTGGYRMLTDLRAVRAALDALRPDHLEVHDRFTLRRVSAWADARGVPATVVVHERLDRIAALHLPGLPGRDRVVRRDNAALAGRFAHVVCPSAWAAEEFTAAGAAVTVVGWGVDHERFAPTHRDERHRATMLRGAQVLLAMVCRLSPEKEPGASIACLRELRRQGVDARLVVAGTGRSAPAMQRAARGLPVTFLGHVPDPAAVAALLAAADVAICPGPVETFGLAALEALASGTPVVSASSGAIPELLGARYGIASPLDGGSMASGVERLRAAGPDARAAARQAALARPWSAPVEAMLGLHGLTSTVRPARRELRRRSAEDGVSMPVAVVAGRYLGVVGVLRDLLRAGGIEVTATWAADHDDGAPPDPQGAVLVVTVGPGDGTLARIRQRGPTGPVVGVTWHPADELDADARGTLDGLVRAGDLTRTLAEVVRGVSVS